jgi:hypothetical protein
MKAVSTASQRDLVLAQLVAIGPDGDPWVRLEARKAPRRARTTAALGPAWVGREVLLGFAGPERTPVVLGAVLAPGDRLESAMAPAVDLVIDRQRITLVAQQELVLRCGKASIRLGADDKIVVRGTNVVSSAAQVNRIRGGAVKIN